MRETIAVKGAREHNLKNVDLEIPRDQLVVFTGLSGSGKSSLAFDTIFAEAQRRFLESLSAWSKRFVEQLRKPDVDFIYGLSPVISIEQKSISKNPRSTVGTMTDIYDYLRALYCTIGVPHCPSCGNEVPIRTALQIAEHVLSLPAGTVVELCAPTFKVYGEDYAYLFAEVRRKGYRRLRVDGAVLDIGEEVELDEGKTYDLEVIVDTFTVKPGIDKQLLTAISDGLRMGEGFLHVRLVSDVPAGRQQAFYAGFACPEHHLVMGKLLPYYFSFNEPDSACVTCLGLGIYLSVHPDLLAPDKQRSLRGGAFLPEAFRYDKNTWNGRIVYSMARHYGFSLDTPFQDLPPAIVQKLFYGTGGERFALAVAEGATEADKHVGRLYRFDGIITGIERRYRRYRQQGEAHTHMENYLRRVMVEHDCPDCQGTRLKRQRLLVTVGGRTIVEAGALTLAALQAALGELGAAAERDPAGPPIIRELRGRLELLTGIGLDYLNLNRKAATLSGGESQRLRLSTQISSGLMGMLYVLDEPSIGLHPRDTSRIIGTMQRLRDIGNSVIVIEHDEATIRAADHIVEMGPGAGVHGGRVVAQGTPAEILRHPDSLTGHYLSGRRTIQAPATRRTPDGQALLVRGARENNLKNIDVAIPLGLLVCVTGVSGSGKSSLVHQILYKRLCALYQDSRVLAGDHDGIDGVEHLHNVVSIDQTPIGRTPTSNPATYIGVYDHIRQLFAATADARTRGYTATRFSFNVKGGRCETCAGRGTVTTQLSFMPDVQVPCPACKGARYNSDTLEVQYKRRSITDVLDMSIDEGAAFFGDHSLITHKLKVLQQLGLGYLKLGQSSDTISGGEAQRVKLAHELGKIKRGGRNLYVLDEPTTGLHLADIQRLLDSLNLLVEAGHSVLVIEHHLDVIKTADWVIDLGPEGGERGGELVGAGTPEELAQIERSFTGQCLRAVLPGFVA
ncbi:MAG TPA: excinuclease ABC subunit UvrA, partial [Chloroflexota bacterium]|nr:excinuclease ABC subunit UvrA [Chloroflexota bacterium]